MVNACILDEHWAKSDDVFSHRSSAVTINSIMYTWSPRIAVFIICLLMQKNEKVFRSTSLLNEDNDTQQMNVGRYLTGAKVVWKENYQLLARHKTQFYRGFELSNILESEVLSITSYLSLKR